MAGASTLSPSKRLRLMLVVAMVAVLPLHTVFAEYGVAWKPFLLLLIAVVAIDAVEGLLTRSWPWHRVGTIGMAVFLVSVLPGVVTATYPERSIRLFLALAAGGMVLLIIERTLRDPAAGPHLLRVVFWSAAALAGTAVVISLLAVGPLGEGAVDVLSDLPGVYRVLKPAYLLSGFIAVTNWHQDPGYAAAWANLWAVLALSASAAGLGSGRRWVDGAVVGGLGFATFMTMSRTGWAVFVVGIAFASLVLVARRVAPWRTVVATLVISAATFLVLIAVTLAVDREGVGADVVSAVTFRIDQNVTLDGGDAGEFGESEGVVDARSAVWPFYVDAFRDNVLAGIGLGTGWARPGVQEPHNLALELLGETGIIGMAGFLVLLGVVLRFGSGEMGMIALVVALLSAVTQTVLFEPTWWFAAGLYLGHARATLDAPMAARSR